MLHDLELPFNIYKSLTNVFSSKLMLRLVDVCPIRQVERSLLHCPAEQSKQSIDELFVDEFPLLVLELDEPFA